MARAARPAVLTVVYVHSQPHVQTTVHLQDLLCNLVHVTSRWIDPDDHPDVHPTGMVHCAYHAVPTVDVKLIERHHEVIVDPDWYDDLLEQKEEKALAS